VGETDNEKSLATVMIRVGGLGSETPKLSVTVNEAVYVPEFWKVTLPGFATLPVAGFPPPKTQE